MFIARARIGGQTGHWKLRYRDFVRVWLATAGFFILCALLVGVVMAVVMAADGAAAQAVRRRRRHRRHAAADGAGAAGRTAARGAGQLLPARAYREARLFQLVWNNVGVSTIARSKTSLRTAAYVWLRVKNMLLTLITLGFYRPFAIASEYAAKVDSVTLYLKGGTDQLVGELVKQQGAFGDAPPMRWASI